MNYVTLRRISFEAPDWASAPHSARIVRMLAALPVLELRRGLVAVGSGSLDRAAVTRLDLPRAEADGSRPDGQRPIDRDVAEALARSALDAEVAAITPEPMRRLLASELLNRCSARLFGLLGPASVLAHGEAGAVADGLVERRLRQAPAASIYGGTTELFRNMIAERFLGLPHHRLTARRRRES